MGQNIWIHVVSFHLNPELPVYCISTFWTGVRDIQESKV